MSQFDDDDEFETDEPTPRDLRKQNDKLRRENAKILERVAAFEAQQRDAAVKAAVEATGLNPKVAALVPKDLAPDAVGTWLTEYADIFGVSPAVPAVPEAKPDLSALERMNSAQSSAPLPSGGSSDDDVIAKINAAKDENEVWQILHAANIPVT